MNLSDCERDSIRQKELELELKYCSQRIFTKNLYELAVYTGKKVIFTSDMYLPPAFIKKMLDKCGYPEGSYELYLSCDLRKTKHTGSLFNHVIKDLKLKPEEILHIGDNRDSDYFAARKCGLKAFYLPKATDIAENKIPDMYGGELIRGAYIEPFLNRHKNVMEDFSGLRCMLALYANKVFDNPFAFFNYQTNFNSQAEIFGYFPVGMHLFALADWLYKNMCNGNYDSLNFMARDGWLPMEAYKIISEHHKKSGEKVPETKLNYVSLSRRTIAPLQIQNEHDVFSILKNFNFRVMTPHKFLNIFESICSKESLSKSEEICAVRGIPFDGFFNTEAELFAFAGLFASDFFSAEEAENYRKLFYDKFSEYFDGKSAVYDIGYSCRIESVLKKTWNFDITPFYLHIINDIPNFRAQKNDMTVNTFYDYMPAVMGLTRDLLFGKTESSIASYRNENGTLVPVFKEIEYNQTAIEIIESIQTNALMFCRDMSETFGQDLKYLYYQKEDASLALEYAFLKPKWVDMQLFKEVYIDDDTNYSAEKINFIDVFFRMQGAANSEYGNAALWYRIKPAFLRLPVTVFSDRRYLKEMIRRKLYSHPALLSFAKKCYKKLKKIVKRH